MTDRTPGAPGQYKAVITAAEFSKMQTGQQFTITMTRDDQPITEGTPYSKAAVLPDELAAVLCPSIVDPTPADAFSALNTNKAPAGFGYGDIMTYYDVQDGTFETTLDEILSGMKGYSAKQIQFYDPEDLYANKFVGNLWKYTPNYAVLEAACYSGIKAVKVKRAGNWYPWEYENPPMVLDTEYRTTERHDGKVVYTKMVDLGTLPNATQKNVTFSKEAANCIRYEIVAHNDEGKAYMFPFTNASVEVKLAASTTRYNFILTTASDLSNYTAFGKVWYTKD